MSKLFVYVTVPFEEAEKIATMLLEKKLVACANIFPAHTALYRWEDKIKSDQEVAMILKTKEDLFDDVRAAICELHSYDIPCIVALPIKKGHEPFLEWIDKEARKVL